MNKMIRTLFILVLMFMLSGCANSSLNLKTLSDRVSINRGINNSKVKVGAYQEDVVKAIGKKPDPSCIKTKTKPDGKYELWDFTSPSCRTDSPEPCILIFKNNILEEIRTSGSALDKEF